MRLLFGDSLSEELMKLVIVVVPLGESVSSNGVCSVVLEMQLENGSCFLEFFKWLEESNSILQSSTHRVQKLIQHYNY